MMMVEELHVFPVKQVVVWVVSSVQLDKWGFPLLTVETKE